MKTKSFELELQRLAKEICAPLSASQSAVSLAILNELHESERGLSEQALLSKVTGRKQIKVSVLRSLVHANIVRRSGGGTKGEPFLYSFPKRDPALQMPTVENGHTTVALHDDEFSLIIEALELLAKARNERGAAKGMLIEPLDELAN